jgi:hypothetical protein
MKIMGDKMLTIQRIKANDLIAQGFTVQETPQGVTASRGNDHRIIWRDGSVRRAMGAKR